MPRVTFREGGPIRGKNLVISCDGEVVGRIATRSEGGFYWYSLLRDRGSSQPPVNTASKKQSLDECKAQAREFFRAHFQKPAGGVDNATIKPGDYFLLPYAGKPRDVLVKAIQKWDSGGPGYWEVEGANGHRSQCYLPSCQRCDLARAKRILGNAQS